MIGMIPKVSVVSAEILFVGLFVLFLSTGIFTTFHIGNFVGCLVSAVLFIAVLKREFIEETVMSLKSSVYGRCILSTLSVFIGFCCLTAVVLSVFMISAACDAPVGRTDTVIVLGCRVKENGPSLMLEKRIETAYKYLSENEHAVCIASGGKGNDEPVSEAECIKQRLVENGISPERIYIEDRSVNTFENIRNSAEVIKENGLSDSVVIVTSEFHQLRASILADRKGLEAYSLSSSTYLPLLPSYWIREWFGVLHELITIR